MPDTLQPLDQRPLIKGALKPPPVQVNPSSYTEEPRPSSEVTIMKQDWQSDPASEAALDLLILAFSKTHQPVFHVNVPTTSDTVAALADKIYKTTICSTSVSQPFVNPSSQLGK